MEGTGARPLLRGAGKWDVTLGAEVDDSPSASAGRREAEMPVS